MSNIITERQLKIIVKESVKEAFGVEFMKMLAKATPLVSKQEQKEIERLYKKPAREAVKTKTLTV
ncbi:MAG: hypothetical protein AAB962_03190 [Patescibacteria group bacterium]